MDLRRTEAPLKQRAIKTRERIIVGLAADCVVRSVERGIEYGATSTTVTLKRRDIYGFIGRFLPALGAKVNERLEDKGISQVEFDPVASKEASQVTTPSEGYLNGNVKTWSEKVVGFVFAPPVGNAKELPALTALPDLAHVYVAAPQEPIEIPIAA